MNRPYLVMVNGQLFCRKLTQAGARKIWVDLVDRGINASMAYDHEGKYNNEN